MMMITKLTSNNSNRSTSKSNNNNNCDIFFVIYKFLIIFDLISLLKLSCDKILIKNKHNKLN